MSKIYSKIGFSFILLSQVILIAAVLLLAFKSHQTKKRLHQTEKALNYSISALNHCTLFADHSTIMLNLTKREYKFDAPEVKDTIYKLQNQREVELDLLNAYLDSLNKTVKGDI